MMSYDVMAHCVESTLADNDFVEQSSDAPDVHLIIIVLWEIRSKRGRESERRKQEIGEEWSEIVKGNGRLGGRGREGRRDGGSRMR